MGIIEIKEVLEEFKKEIEKLYSKRLKRVILYGTYAGGDATEDSDMDLLIVLERNVITGEEIDRMIDIVTEMNLYGVLISVYPNPISKGEKDVMKCYEML